MKKHDGENGFVLLTGADTSTAGDEFKVLQALTDTTITFDVVSTAGQYANAETSVTSLVIPGGSFIYGGRFHNLDQASGSLIAYFA